MQWGAFFRIDLNPAKTYSPEVTPPLSSPKLGKNSGPGKWGDPTLPGGAPIHAAKRGRGKRSEAKVLHSWALWGYLEEEPGYENSIRISGGFFRSFVYQG